MRNIRNVQQLMHWVQYRRSLKSETKKIGYKTYTNRYKKENCVKKTAVINNY